MRQAVILVGCAWILWGHAIYEGREDWMPFRVYPDQATCERYLKAQMDKQTGVKFFQ
jgi:hypothetical protein